MKGYKGNWIKLHRNLLNNMLFDNPKILKVWIWCSLKATHKEKQTIVGNQAITLNPGEFIFGRNAAAKELKIKPSTVRTIMLKLEEFDYLDIKTTNKFSLVKIKNWNNEQGYKKTEEGQNIDNEEVEDFHLTKTKKQKYKRTNEQLADNNLATRWHHSDRNKNVKKLKNVKKFFKKEIYKEKEILPAQMMEQFIIDSKLQQETAKAIQVKFQLNNHEVIQQLQAFLAYWTELSLDGKKERWQLQRFFQVNHKLLSWFNNYVASNKSNSSRFLKV